MTVEYKKPTNNDICVGYCYYNPSGDKVILDNTLALEARLKQANIPYYNIELVNPDSKPVLVNPTVVVQASSTLLYKESLWNLLEKQIPETFTKICFMDTNLEYNRGDWVDCISLILNFYDIIQPYNQVNILDESGNKINTIQGAIKSLNSGDIQGNAWAVNRSFFQSIGGFLDKSVISSNLFFNAITGQTLGMPLLENYYSQYVAKIKAIRCKVKYLNSEVNSRFNGPTQDISTLNDAIKSLEWNNIFSLNTSGLWELNSTFNLVEAVSTIPVISPVNDIAELTEVTVPVLPEVIMPEVIVPEVPEVSEVIVPEVTEVTVPEVRVSDRPKVSRLKLSKLKVPGVTVPGVTVPGVTVPVVTVPKLFTNPRETPEISTTNVVPCMIKLSPSSKNNADRAAAAALIASFKKR